MKTAYIAISYICNQKCSFCPCSKEEKRYREPELHELKASVNDMIHNAGIDGIVVSGGEPTLYRYFTDFVKFLCEKDLKVTILSTSERFSDQTFFGDFVSQINPDKVEVISTIHSHMVEQHEGINGTRGSFERTIKGLMNLNSAGIHTTVKHCVTRENYKDLRKFYEFIDSRFPESVDIQMCSIDYCGLKEDYDKHMLCFPDLEPYFEEMFDCYIEQKENGNVRHMYCINMPLCSADPYYWDFFAQKPEGYSSYAAASDKGDVRTNREVGRDVDTFGSLCRDCKVESICAGTYRTAFELFGCPSLSLTGSKTRSASWRLSAICPGAAKTSPKRASSASSCSDNVWGFCRSSFSMAKR